MRCNEFGIITYTVIHAVASKSPDNFSIVITLALNPSSLNAVQCAAALVRH